MSSKQKKKVTIADSLQLLQKQLQQLKRMQKKQTIAKPAAVIAAAGKKKKKAAVAVPEPKVRKPPKFKNSTKLKRFVQTTYTRLVASPKTSAVIEMLGFAPTATRRRLIRQSVEGVPALKGAFPGRLEISNAADTLLGAAAAAATRAFVATAVHHAAAAGYQHPKLADVHYALGQAVTRGHVPQSAVPELQALFNDVYIIKNPADAEGEDDDAMEVEEEDEEASSAQADEGDAAGASSSDEEEEEEDAAEGEDEEDA